MRSTVNPKLMQLRNVKLYIPTIDGFAKEFMEKIPTFQDDKGEMRANFNEHLNCWS